MRLTLEALIVLDTIDRKGSFAAAADELHRVPSAITYTVRKLEQDLSVKLFDRSGHRARLTPAGEKLLDDGRHLLKAAWELECATKRIATGWEVTLSITVDSIIPLERLYPTIEEFYQKDCGTQLRFSRETLEGSWNALMAGQTDLIIGITGDMPSVGGYSYKQLGRVEFSFVVAPQHPLAHYQEPLSEQDIEKYRTIYATDYTRHIYSSPHATVLLNGHDVFTVPDLASKREAQLRGLGVGYLPQCLIQDDLNQGRLIAKTVAGPDGHSRAFIAWRTQQKGKALQWFLKRLQKPELFTGIIVPD
jgi:DNA-binding transcriptional LysR family regulator